MVLQIIIYNIKRVGFYKNQKKLFDKKKIST